MFQIFGSIQSPDYNPIENVWVHIKAKLIKRNFKDNDQLYEAVKEE